MILKIPCKTCVVQPLCSQLCDKLTTYSRKLHRIKLSFVIFLATPILLPVIFELIFGKYSEGLFILFMFCFLLIMIFSGSGIWFIIKRENELNRRIVKIRMVSAITLDKHGIRIPPNRKVR